MDSRSQTLARIEAATLRIRRAYGFLAVEKRLFQEEMTSIKSNCQHIYEESVSANGSGFSKKPVCQVCGKAS